MWQHHDKHYLNIIGLLKQIFSSYITIIVLLCFTFCLLENYKWINSNIYLSIYLYQSINQSIYNLFIYHLLFTYLDMWESHVVLAVSNSVCQKDWLSQTLYSPSSSSTFNCWNYKYVPSLLGFLCWDSNLGFCVY